MSLVTQAESVCLRNLHAEIARLRAEVATLEHQLRAAKTIIEGADRRAIESGREIGELSARAAEVAGERAANALLTEEAEAYKERIAGLVNVGHALAATIEEQRAEVEALRADAERYRWLRANNAHYLHNRAWLNSVTATKDGPCDIFSADEVPALLDAEVDRRIDAARKA